MNILLGLPVRDQSTVLQSRLNRLSLFLDLTRSPASEVVWNIPELKALQSETRPQIQPLLSQLLTTQFSQLPAIQSVYARLNFVDSLMQVDENAQLKQLLPQREKSPFSVAFQLTQETVRVAHDLENKRAESYALGTIGKLYAEKGQVSQSK